MTKEDSNKPKKAIVIKTKNYFEDVIYYLGWGMLVFGILLMIVNPIVCFIIAVLGLIIITTHYKLIVDFSNQTIIECTTILFFDMGKDEKKFTSLNYIKIKEISYSQKMNMESLSNTIRGKMYKAFLYSDSDSYYLGESKKESHMLSKAQKISEKLNVKIE